MWNHEVRIYQKGRERRLVGRVLWSPSQGLIWEVPMRGVKSSLRRAVERRIKEGRYYVAYAVRGGKESLVGLRFDRASALGPELLGCIAADEGLWRAAHGSVHLVGEIVEREGR